MVQQIRGSQFVITYGPGSIIEGVEGPRVISRPDIGLFFKGSSKIPDDFEIPDQRMSQGLLSDAGIFRLPSNAEVNENDSRYIYRTKAFPIWRLCLNMQRHNGHYYILHQEYSCPVCGSRGKRGSEPIRFVKACSAGHMDEVDWYIIAHADDKTCDNRHMFRWYGGGGSLSQVRIECPKCGKSVMSLGTAYGKDWHCTGRYPEREGTTRAPVRSMYDCEQSARIIQRQASNLRIPELLTLFAVYPRHTALHNILQRRPIYYALQAVEPTSFVQLQNLLKNLESRGSIGRDTFDSITRYPWKELQAAISDVLKPVPTSYHDLILEEYKCLVDGSLKGIPPVRGPAPKSPVLIEINPSLVKKFTGPNGNLLRITPISTLTTVTVQKGYRREVYTKSLPTREMATLVDVSFPDPSDEHKRWYPGVQYLGEGVFITFDGTDFKVANKAADDWSAAYEKRTVYPEYVFRDPAHREELQPLFVWWHTFSHLLIREMASEAGYSSAAIRERIYIDETGVSGGVLFYATQPGSEGTLGGLTALVPHFQEIIDGALSQLDMCSADPLCIEHRFKIGDYNGAACYGCLLLSETSCAHRNMWLDRNIMLENLP
jgi:ssDNA-binding Zn-finger/Zn-ribbon topoisomerase 1